MLERVERTAVRSVQNRGDAVMSQVMRNIMSAGESWITRPLGVIVAPIK